MGGSNSIVSMGYIVAAVIVIYLLGVGISSLVQYIKKKMNERK